MSEKFTDYMSQLYTPFEQNLSLAWAQAHLAAFLTQNPHSTLDEREKEFLEALEGGFGVALEFRKHNA